MNRLAELPLIGSRLQPCLFDPQDTQAILIPVHETIQGSENVVLPFTLLPALIEQASHLTVLNHCMCRQAEGCQVHPQDLGSYEEGFPLSQSDMQRGYREWRSEFRLTYTAIAANALCDYGMSDPATRDIAFKAIEAAAALDIPILQLPSFVKGDVATAEGCI